MCGKDEIRIDDIEHDGYLIENEFVVHNVAKGSMDDYNNNVRVIDVEVVIEEEDVVIKWMCITYDDNEKRKEVIMRTTHGKEGKDASRWWDVQLNRGGCIVNISVSYLKERYWLIRKSTWFLDSVRQDTSTVSQENRRRRLDIGLRQ